MSKRGIPKRIPITDPRVVASTNKLIEKYCEELKKCKNNPSHLYTKSYFKTTM